MESKILKLLLIVSAAVLFAGCKLEIVAVQGGDVAWSGGNCSEGSNCVVEITDPNFSDSFTVTPKPGYEFLKWHKGAGFLCGDSTSLTCALAMPADANVTAAVIGVFATGYIMPIYKDVGIDTDNDGIKDRVDDNDDNDSWLDIDDPCPLDPTPNCFIPSKITDTVLVNGKEWAQVDLFINLSWTEISAVCPAGECIDGGVLNGHDMTGWRWAFPTEVNTLLNYYVGSSKLGLEPDVIYQASSPWGPAFFEDGWRPTTVYWFGGRATSGHLAQAGPRSDTSYVGHVGESDDPTSNDYMRTDLVGLRTDKVDNTGAWFYRRP